MTIVARETNVTADQLIAYIERLEKLDEEKKVVAEDFKDVLAEAVGNGYDKKIIRKILKLRKIDKQTRDNEEALLETYMNAVGMTGGAMVGVAA